MTRGPGGWVGSARADLEVNRMSFHVRFFAWVRETSQLRSYISKSRIRSRVKDGRVMDRWNLSIVSSVTSQCNNNLLPHLA